jgi:predicted metal-dependent RNase
MEPSEEIKTVLEEIRDTQREHLALCKKFARRSHRGSVIQRITLALVFVGLVGLIGLACLMVYLFSFFGFLMVH